VISALRSTINRYQSEEVDREKLDDSQPVIEQDATTPQQIAKQENVKDGGNVDVGKKVKIRRKLKL
jgi:hypothetical protein